MHCVDVETCARDLSHDRVGAPDVTGRPVRNDNDLGHGIEQPEDPFVDDFAAHRQHHEHAARLQHAMHSLETADAIIADDAVQPMSIDNGVKRGVTAGGEVHDVVDTKAYSRAELTRSLVSPFDTRCRDIDAGDAVALLGEQNRKVAGTAAHLEDAC